ncbi:MAG: metal ABC transporter substrate-binding protein [Halieaceae bacterium]
MRRVNLLLCLLMLSACGQQLGDPTENTETVETSQAPGIYSVNYPLAWAAQELAGDAAEVHFPAPAGIDPAFWQPDINTVADYQQAELILLNGANYAKWIARVSLPQNRLLDTSQGFTDQLIAADTGPLHSHGPEGDHSHGELAFTVWLDVSLYSQQVSAIAESLSQRLPESAELIVQRRNELLSALRKRDDELTGIGRRLDGAPLLYSHPVYQYLQRRYQLNGKALHWEPDQSPADTEWVKLDRLLQSHPARIMLWEAEPTAGTRAQLLNRGITPVVLRPMGNRPDSGNYLENLGADTASLAAAVRTLTAD